MKFTVELDDFWMDEDSSGIEIELKRYIIRDVANQIKASIKEAIEIEIRQVVENKFKESLETEVAMVTRELIESGEVKRNPQRSDSGKVTIKEWITNTIESQAGWSTPQKQLAEYAKKHMDEIKKRYDFLYASSVVQKMADLGMLKDDKIAELLTKD